jgi:GT2 family glycosyltransferase
MLRPIKSSIGAPHGPTEMGHSSHECQSNQGSPPITGYALYYNNADTIEQALDSLAGQSVAPCEMLVVDDGSTDGGVVLSQKQNLRWVRQGGNWGRGAARARALREAHGELVLCCDATNVLPLDFVRRLLPWFEDPKVAAVYGRIQDTHPVGAVGRWRARHLFKAGLAMTVAHRAPLMTYGALMRRSAVLEVGNFDPALRHSEDAELGARLLAAGYDIVFDPSIPVICNVQNTLSEVLERYWRWNVGVRSSVTMSDYFKLLAYALKVMAAKDMQERDPASAMISLLCPHSQFWRSKRQQGQNAMMPPAWPPRNYQ